MIFTTSLRFVFVSYFYPNLYLYLPVLLIFTTSLRFVFVSYLYFYFYPNLYLCLPVLLIVSTSICHLGRNLNIVWIAIYRPIKQGVPIFYGFFSHTKRKHKTKLENKTMKTAKFWTQQLTFVFHFWLPFGWKRRSGQITLFAKVRCWLNFKANLNVDLCSGEEDGGWMPNLMKAHERFH